MATKKRKKTLRKVIKPAVKSSGILTTVIISLVIVAAAAAAGIVVSKVREKSLSAGNVSSTVSPESITITDTATGKTSQIQVKPASAGSTQASNQATNININNEVPVDYNQAAINAAARVSTAAKTGDYSYLLNPLETKEAIPHIDIAEAKYLFDSGKAIFVDARGMSEYNEGHIKGSVNVPVIATAEEVEKLKSKLTNKVLVTYCHGVGCRLSDKSAYKLWDAGYRKIAIFFGGWPKWNEHKYPVVTKTK